MNERIKELAEQAGVYFAEGSTDYFGDYLPPFMSITNLDLEKFAESIVKECARICVKEARQLGGRVCSDKIKDHFGVEL